MHETTAEALVGLSESEWRSRLADLHRTGRYEELARVLTSLAAEIQREQRTMALLDDAPWYHRYRQLTEFHLTPAQHSDLFDEVSAELRLQSHYRRVLLEAQLPRSLWKYIDMCGVELAPDASGLQFEGFGKYGGIGEGPEVEIVTFFARIDPGPRPPQVPAHFFGRWGAQSGRFVIDRAYRGPLPRGSGARIVAEQIVRLAPPEDLRTLRLKNVVNTATRSALVRDASDGTAELIERAEFLDTVLGRFIRRVLREIDLAPGDTRPSLSTLGHLHVDVDVMACS